MTNANAPAPNSTTPYGLPQRITTTYDHFGFERHQVNKSTVATGLALATAYCSAVLLSAYLRFEVSLLRLRCVLSRRSHTTRTSISLR